MNFNSIPPPRQSPIIACSSMPFVLIILLTLAKFTLATSNNVSDNSQTSIDGDVVTIGPRHNFEISVEHGTSQSDHDATTLNFATITHQKQSTVQTPYENNDPFALTFEDYLREASKSTSHHVVSSTDDSSVSPGVAIPDTSGLIIEEDENSVKQKESPIIDYIFPPSRQETLLNKQDTRQMSKQLENKDSNPIEVLNEIKLLFAWKQLPTNKCSKTCGRGYRINHLSCVDLKYDVRVEDELCQKSNLPKPNATGSDPCNEIDCSPEWTSVELQGCNPVDSTNGLCHSHLYKRVQCIMINRNGVSIPLDDSKCNSTTSHSPSTPAPEPKTTRQFRDESKLRIQDVDEESIDFKIDTHSESNEGNDIISNIDADSSMESSLHGFSSSNRIYPQNEPFFEPLSWSECSGALCGQLGKRTRKVSCRLYLSRSSKFAELPESSCHSAFMPETQEPCYIDCAPDSTQAINSTDTILNLKSNLSEYSEETIYDPEVDRFIWKKGGWTRCSADCLGGRRETIIECWDKVEETTVDSILCNQDLRPQAISEVCNDIPCPPEWRIEAFSKCTKSCGSAGVKTRSIACVQQVPIQEGSSYLLVSNDLCIQSNRSMPHKIEPCNRIDCRPEWELGPWSQCSKRCGEGIRNRTVICVQEFANRDGPRYETSHKHPHKTLSPDLLDAVVISSRDWQPGKVTQVPFQECYEEYGTVPALEERCFNFCDKKPYIDAEPEQDLLDSFDNSGFKRNTVTIKIGGRAKVLEGRTLRIRCKIINRSLNSELVKKGNEKQAEWRKDGIKIFTNGSKVADKQYVTEDNSIFSNDVFADEKNQFMADDPNSRRSEKLTTHSPLRPRNLNVRSWDNYRSSYLNSHGHFNFVSQNRGRFALKDNYLRIKQLRHHDSGNYTCSYGQLSESLDLKVIRSRGGYRDNEEKLINSLGI